MNLIRILVVWLLGFGLVACGNSDTVDTVEAAEAGVESSQDNSAGRSGFLESAQQAVANARKTAEKMEDGAQATEDQIAGALSLEEDEEDKDE